MVLRVLKCWKYICNIECGTPCDTLRQRRPAELTHCSLSSLCVVPVTLTLSNCAMAKMDVMVDLQHKPTRLVCSGRETCHLLTPIVGSTCWNVLICLCCVQPRVSRCAQFLYLGGSEPVQAAPAAWGSGVSHAASLFPPARGLQPKYTQSVCSAHWAGRHVWEQPADGDSSAHHHQQGLSERARGHGDTTERPPTHHHYYLQLVLAIWGKWKQLIIFWALWHVVQINRTSFLEKGLNQLMHLKRRLPSSFTYPIATISNSQLALDKESEVIRHLL